MAAKEPLSVQTAVTALKQVAIKGGLLASALFGGSLAGQQGALPWAEPGGWGAGCLGMDPVRIGRRRS